MKTAHNSEHGFRLGTPDAFTLMELIVVLVFFSLFTSTVLAALAKGSAKSKALACLTNQRKLIVAWQKYAMDHNGSLVHSYHGGGRSRRRGGCQAPEPALGDGLAGLDHPLG